MRRGDILAVAGGPGYAGKPRPALVLQADAFDRVHSVTVCLITSTAIESPNLRVALPPTAANGLRSPSWVMIDKLMTYERRKIGRRMGTIEPACLSEVETRVAVFLGLARHPAR